MRSRLSTSSSRHRSRRQRPRHRSRWSPTGTTVRAPKPIIRASSNAPRRGSRSRRGRRSRAGSVLSPCGTPRECRGALDGGSCHLAPPPVLLRNPPESLVRRFQVESLGVDRRLPPPHSAEPFPQFLVSRVVQTTEGLQEFPVPVRAATILRGTCPPALHTDRGGGRHRRREDILDLNPM